MDQNRNNNSEDNLAFLCLQHHDQYDSKTSQSKGFTISEVKKYREELYGDIEDSLSLNVHFGKIRVSSTDPYAGKYVRIGSDSDAAEVYLTPLPDTPYGEPQYHINGLALYGTDRECGPSIGELSKVGQMFEEGKLYITEPRQDGSHFKLSLECEHGEITIIEDNFAGYYGVDVTFSGNYKKIPEEKSS